MSLAARSILIGAMLLAAYYALIFGYAARMRAERHEHVAWRFPLQAGSDFCADTLPNGACVCSDRGTVFIVKDGKQLAKFVAFAGNDETGDYAPYEGYQWVGGTRDNLAFVSAARPPMNELSLYAIDCSGKVRWETKLPPGEIVTWIACTPDSIFVLTYATVDDAKHRQTMQVSHVHRYTLDGQRVYNIQPARGVMQLAVTADNWAYVADSADTKIEARDPGGKLMWQTKTGGEMPIYSRFGTGKTLFYYDNLDKLHGVGRDGKELFVTQLPTQSTYRTPSLAEALRMALGNSGHSPYNYGYNQSNFADGGGRIYRTNGAKLIAVDTAGHPQWERTLHSDALAVAADSQGRAYVTLSSGGLDCYSAAGRELWRNSSFHTFNSALSVAHDDHVFVEADNELICIKP